MSLPQSTYPMIRIVGQQDGVSTLEINQRPYYREMMLVESNKVDAAIEQKLAFLKEPRPVSVLPIPAETADDSGYTSDEYEPEELPDQTTEYDNLFIESFESSVAPPNTPEESWISVERKRAKREISDEEAMEMVLMSYQANTPKNKKY